jgi:hypothetical protein
MNADNKPMMISLKITEYANSASTVKPSKKGHLKRGRLSRGQFVHVPKMKALSN